MTPYEAHAGVCGITRVPASTPRDLRRSSGDTFLAEPQIPREAEISGCFREGHTDTLASI